MPDGKLLVIGQRDLSCAEPDPRAEPPQRPPPRQVIVTLPAEIDISNAGQVEDTLVRALRDGTAVLIADGAATEYCGCSGMHALMRIHHQAASAGAELRVAASPALRRMLELTGADQVLDVYPTLAIALVNPPS